MSRRHRTLIIAVAVVGALLLVAGVSVAAVLVARDAANGSQAAAAPTGESAGLVAALDDLDVDASWTLAERLRGGSDGFEAWSARLYSSSRAPTRSKDAVTMLQGAGQTTSSSCSTSSHETPRTSGS